MKKNGNCNTTGREKANLSLPPLENRCTRRQRGIIVLCIGALYVVACESPACNKTGVQNERESKRKRKTASPAGCYEVWVAPEKEKIPWPTEGHREKKIIPVMFRLLAFTQERKKT